VPIAARHVRDGLSYRADLITQEIIGARSLATCLAAAPLAPIQWQLIGKTLARFHLHGVHHADLNAHNIVFDQNGSVFVLDFDRGVIRRRHQQWVDKVLARLLRSLEKLRAKNSIHFDVDNWNQLLTAHDSNR
jgi:3-deoxy-D-manno-octulosonic acid kinase